MGVATGLVIVKRFNYRGDPNEEWSNKYWLSGTPPATEAAWKTLADAVIAGEKQCYTAGTFVTRAYGYNDNSADANSVWSYDYGLNDAEVAGTLAPGTNPIMAGDQAGTFSFKTTRKTSRGKYIYLRKFMHDGCVDLNDTDSISAATLGAYDAWRALLLSGTLADNRFLFGPHGEESFLGSQTSPYVTTRTLKRRGKRPLPAS